MKLSILVVSKTYSLLNTLFESISYATDIDNNSIEILCSWNGLESDISLIKKNFFDNLYISTVIPYHFASNMNQLLEMAKGEYLILVNDDVIFDIKSIDKGIECFNQNSNAVLVGSRLRNEKGNLSHAGILFNLLHRPYHFLEDSIKHDHHIVSQFSYPVSAVTGALMLTKLEFIKPHRFNTNYLICGEDVELCLDLRENYNKDIYCCYEFSAIHQAETTRSQNPEQYKTFKDNLLISGRYLRFLLKSNISNIENEFNIIQRNLKIYKKYRVNKLLLSKNRKWDLTLFILSYYIKLVIFIRKILMF
tara:strand:+ start:31 stop:948 length:918 start_codon:yes stop_codon:yes gene_type:complete